MNAIEAKKFLNLVFDKTDPEHLQEKMTGCFGPKRNYYSHNWIWKMKADDVNDQTGFTMSGKLVGSRCGPPKFEFFVILVMPRAHLNFVTERVLSKCKMKL